jgi:hypothetical protein
MWKFLGFPVNFLLRDVSAKYPQSIRICGWIQFWPLCSWLTTTSKIGIRVDIRVDVTLYWMSRQNGLKEWKAHKQENWRVREKGRAITWHPIIMRYNFILTSNWQKQHLPISQSNHTFTDYEFWIQFNVLMNP